jgi:hypothetical protein
VNARSMHSPFSRAWRQQHKTSIRFACVAVVSFALLYGMRKMLTHDAIPPGRTYLLAMWIFFVAAPGRLQMHWLGGAIALTLMALSAPLLANYGFLNTNAWLLCVQCGTFLFWSVWYWTRNSWSRDSHTLWSIAAALQLMLLPSLTMTHAIMGFGLVTIVSLWLVGETGKL